MCRNVALIAHSVKLFEPLLYDSQYMGKTLLGNLKTWGGDHIYREGGQTRCTPLFWNLKKACLIISVGYGVTSHVTSRQGCTMAGGAMLRGRLGRDSVLECLLLGKTQHSGANDISGLRGKAQSGSIRQAVNGMHIYM